MYKIIGANQMEYGPVSADQLRAWIAEGRVNAQTPVQAEGETTWRPLSTYPELASALPPSAAPAAVPGVIAVAEADGRTRAVSLLTGPAIALIVTGCLGICYGIFSILQYLIVGTAFKMPPNAAQSPEMQHFSEVMGGIVGVTYIVLAIILWAIVIWGGINMRKLQKHGLCFAASIIAMTPCVCPCCLLGIPFGIWALVILNKPDVKQYFS